MVGEAVGEAVGKVVGEVMGEVMEVVEVVEVRLVGQATQAVRVGARRALDSTC